MTWREVDPNMSLASTRHVSAELKKTASFGVDWRREELLIGRFAKASFTFDAGNLVIALHFLVMA